MQGRAVARGGTAAAKDVRQARRVRHVLRVLSAATGAGLRLRHALLPLHHDDPGLHARVRQGMGLRRGIEGDDEGDELGRRAPPRPLRDERRLRRAVALHQRHAPFADRADRPERLHDQGDLRADPERLGRARLSASHAQHRVRVRGVALLDPDPLPDRRRGEELRARLQGDHRGRQGLHRRAHVAGIRDPDASVRLGPVRRRQGPSHGWQFFTCYNSEMAYDSLEIKASQNEMDYLPPSTGAPRRRPRTPARAA